ncbi:cytoskeleton-associated protein 4 isoform X2 [Strigops habroptila]|uniref:cytoskeleton-associated protein 4 isoform X2 n=1 Tax=Strigops habroptila TaxID=2489341 RepID=UPI0011CF547D|nr:cytoskeleton-associated protein 4 isoform X2 [Strigops habroptila]
MALGGQIEPGPAPANVASVKRESLAGSAARGWVGAGPGGRPPGQPAAAAAGGSLPSSLLQGLGAKPFYAAQAARLRWQQCGGPAVGEPAGGGSVSSMVASHLNPSVADGLLFVAASSGQVRSLQATFGEFESMMKIAQQKQEVTEKAVKQGESEINRISEVLQKLQNEILKDLSDGIHMVKDARERDFTSLENTVEERLTELTKSINDNIAVFTEVQQRSQDEINNMKAKVDSLEEADVYKHEIKVLKDAFGEMQASMKTKEKDIESLKSTVDSMESDVYTEVKELVNLKQEHEKFKEAADTEHLSLKALQEKVLRAEDSIMHLPGDIKRLDEDLLQVKADLNKWEENELFRKALETFGKNSEGLESRLRHIEDSLESLTSAAAQNSENLQSFLSKEAEYKNKLSTLEQSITALQGISDMDLTSVTAVLKNLGESQTSLYNDVENLRRSISELPSSDALQDVQKQISILLDQGNLQAGEVQSQGYLEKFSSVEGSVDELRSSVSQVDSDLKMIRTAVDSLVSYSVKIENNENNLESVKSSIDDLRNDLERLFVKVEKIHEKV